MYGIEAIKVRLSSSSVLIVIFVKPPATIPLMGLANALHFNVSSNIGFPFRVRALDETKFIFFAFISRLSSVGSEI